MREAEERARAEAAELGNAWERDRRTWQAAMDEQWAALNANDSATVLTVLADAFEDNEAAAAAVGAEGSEVTLVVLVPNASTVPDRRPTTTPAGNLSLKKLTKGETAEMYKQLVCGHSLVTIKEAFAVAPAITSARVVALRPAAPDAYGTIRPEVVLAARFERAKLDGIQWADADAFQITHEASDELVLIQKGATKELSPIDLSKETALAHVAQAVDFDDLRS